jgi:protein required for attachment to host cells
MRLNSAQIEQASIIWVLVADGGHAQIYRYHQHKALVPMKNTKREPFEEKMKHHELTPITEMKFAAEPLDNFQVGHDGRGSKIGGARPGHNTCEPHLDIHEEVKQNLVKEIADKLKHAYETKAFDPLVKSTKILLTIHITHYLSIYKKR